MAEQKGLATTGNGVGQGPGIVQPRIVGPGEVKFATQKTEYYPAWGFRDKIVMYPIEMAFIFINGGMGDYITWFTAIEWLASEAKWIKGTIVIPNYFKEFAEYLLRPYPDWKFTFYQNMGELPNVNQLAFRGPVQLDRESLNATGAHLSTCGWVYFTNKERAPEGWDRYPVLKQDDLNKIELPAEAAQLQPGKYVVITTGQTTNSRKTPPGAWNYVIDHVIERGLTPVFLGKSVMDTGNPQNIHTAWQKELDYSKGVDLRDKTSLMQCAAVMSRAACVVGHDNGLLHLAGCTEVPIVFGYNLASPEHREPKRAVGRTINVVLTHEELACNFCQSKTNFVIGYNFRECFYKDNKCMEMLFENRAERWKQAIDRALTGG